MGLDDEPVKLTILAFYTITDDVVVEYVVFSSAFLHYIASTSM